MLWRRHQPQEKVAGKAEKGQGADARIWQCEHSAGSVYCGFADGGGVGGGRLLPVGHTGAVAFSFDEI